MSSSQLSSTWRTETDLDPYNLTRYGSSSTGPLDPYNQIRGSTQIQQQPQIRTASSSSLIQSQSQSQSQSLSTQQQQRSSGLLTTGFELSDRILGAAQYPIELSNATETLTVQQQTGIHVNVSEAQSWKGSPPLSEYPINFDSSPEVIEKRLLQVPNYVQPITIKYLKPPVPARTGEITIRQEQDLRLPKAPPVIIRQKPREPFVPVPIVLREQPPQQPEEIPRKYVSICGRNLPPPPRRLVVEKLAQMPEKPQPIEIERWMQYGEQTRMVKFIAAEPVPNWEKEKNLVIVWQAPQARITKDLRTLETLNGDPEEYRRMYGNSLLTFSQMNARLRELNVGLPEPSVAARSLPRLEGDLEALRMIDLDRWGLSEYKYLVQGQQLQGQQQQQVTQQVQFSSSSWVGQQGSFYEEVWAEAVVNADGQVTPKEARRLIVLIHQRMDKQVDASRLDKFIVDVTNARGLIEFGTFKKLVVTWVESRHGTQTLVRKDLVGQQGSFYEEVWAEAVVNADGQVTPEEARRLVVLIHQRMDKQVDASRLDKFIVDVTTARGLIEFGTFKKLVVNWVSL